MFCEQRRFKQSNKTLPQRPNGGVGSCGSVFLNISQVAARRTILLHRHLGALATARWRCNRMVLADRAWSGPSLHGLTSVTPALWSRDVTIFGHIDAPHTTIAVTVLAIRRTYSEVRVGAGSTVVFNAGCCTFGRCSSWCCCFAAGPFSSLDHFSSSTHRSISSLDRVTSSKVPRSPVGLSGW